MKHLYKLILLLSLFSILKSTVSAQNLIEIVESNFNSKVGANTFTRYKVLSSNPDIKHGNFYEVSVDDKLLIQGQYSKGEATGEWTTYYPNYQEAIAKIENYSSGSIHTKEKHPNGSNKIEGSFIVVGNNKTKTGSWKYWNKQGKLVKEEEYNEEGNLDGEIILYNQNGQVVKTQYYVNGDLTNSKDEFFHQKTRIEKELEKTKRFELDFPDIYKNEVKDFRKLIKKYNSLENSVEKYNLGTTISTDLLNINGMYVFFKTEEDEIEQIYRKICGTYEKEFPPIFKAQIKNEKKTIAEYNKQKTIIEKQNLGKNIIKKISFFDDHYMGLKRQNEKIIADFNTVKMKFSDFENIVNGEIKKLQSDITAYKASNDLLGKLDLGNRITENLSYLNRSYEKLIQVNNEIDQNLIPLLKNYSNDYPTIYKNEIQSFKGEVDVYKNSSILKEKLNYGDHILERIEELSTEYKELKELDVVVIEKKDEVIYKFKDEFPNIYKVEIKGFIELVKTWTKSQQVSIRISDGRNLVIKADNLLLIVKELTQIKMKIDEKTPEMLELYRTDLPKLFNGEISEIKEKIETWKKISESTVKERNGNELVTVLNSAISKQPRLLEQKDLINEGYLKISELYKRPFPKIYSNEIANIQIKEYAAVTYLKEKELKGDKIQGIIANLNSDFDYLIELKDRIEGSAITLNENYKKQFPIVYKNQVSTIQDRIKIWLDVSNTTAKRTIGDPISTDINYMNSQINNLLEQREKINADFENLEISYKGNKPNKLLFKKGKKAYKELYALYEEEGNIDKKTKSGQRVNILLNKLISLANSENKRILQRLKSCKTAREIERAIGIK